MIFIDTWARWRIVDPQRFFTACTTMDGGQKTLDDLVDSAVRDVVGSHNLIEVVRSSNRELVYEAEDDIEEDRPQQANIDVGREKMEQAVREKAGRGLTEKYGIELVDVRIKRINYVESVRKSVYERMIAERDRIAARYDSEAEEQRDIILGETNKELAIIEGEGEEKSKKVRGEGDAEAIKIYGEAMSKDPEFYALLRALEAYRTSFSTQTEIILTTDSPFLKFMEQHLEMTPKPPKKQRSRP
jgi:membrane protease subunit HflC